MPVKKILVDFGQSVQNTIISLTRDMEEDTAQGDEIINMTPLPEESSISSGVGTMPMPFVDPGFRLLRQYFSDEENDDIAEAGFRALTPKEIKTNETERLRERVAYNTETRNQLQALLQTECSLSQAEPIELEANTLLDIDEEAENWIKYNLWLYQDVLYGVTGKFSKSQQKLLVLEEADKDRQKFERLVAKFSNEQAENIKYERTRIHEQVRIEVWRRDQGKCASCGSRENLEYDHIVPVSRGGSNTARNVELLCQGCNRGKGDKIQ